MTKVCDRCGDYATHGKYCKKCNEGLDRIAAQILSMKGVDEIWQDADLEQQQDDAQTSRG